MLEVIKGFKSNRGDLTFDDLFYPKSFYVDCASLNNYVSNTYFLFTFKGSILILILAI